MRLRVMNFFLKFEEIALFVVAVVPLIVSWNKTSKRIRFICLSVIILLLLLILFR